MVFPFTTFLSRPSGVLIDEEKDTTNEGTTHLAKRITNFYLGVSNTLVKRLLSEGFLLTSFSSVTIYLRQVQLIFAKGIP
jgi:hypothetical protein